MSSDDDDDLACRLDVACGEILAAKKHESTLVHLFTQVPAGRWMQLDGLPSGVLDVFVTWLHLPSESDKDLRLVLFLHEESAWSMTATYNAERLFRGTVGPNAARPI